MQKAGRQQGGKNFTWHLRPKFSGVARGLQGFTLTELVIGLTVLAIVALSFFGLFTSLVDSATVAKNRAVATTLATNQMEYLKSLPYDSLVVAGGSIYSPNPLPASTTQKVNGVTYTVVTSVGYIDDAYDGCTNYPNQQLKQLYCRNYPPPAVAPAVDSNPQDYKIVHVTVKNNIGVSLAKVDTEISARVAETSSSSGALFVSVIDGNGNPVSGANVHVVNTVIGPVDVSDDTDSKGNAIFYGLPPDTNNYDYTVTASKAAYSSLTTIVPAGSLQPTYPNQKIFVQQSSYLTLTIKPQGANSLVIETTDTTGNPLAGVKVYVKGGYKKYTATTDTSYYFDNLTPTDSRLTTDVSGLAGVSNLVPGAYIFCGDLGATSCNVGGTTYYLVAALPYSGSNSFNPVSVPIYDPAAPPPTTFVYGSNNYLQKVRLMLTTNAAFPRIFSLSPDDVSLSGGTIASFAFHITGANLACGSSPGSCGTTVQFLQASNTYTAACTGVDGSTDLSCTVDLTGATVGNLRLVISVGGNTLNLPDSPPIGVLNVAP